MGFFSRNRGSGRASVIPAEEVARLSAVGRAVYFEGQHVDVSGFYRLYATNLGRRGRMLVTG